MSIDFGRELENVKKQLANLEEDVSESVKNSLEDMLNWAKKGYQRQVLNERIKSKVERIISEKQDMVTKEWCAESLDEVNKIKSQLTDAFTSKSSKKLQDKMEKRAKKIAYTEEDLITLKKSFKTKGWF